MGVEKDTGKFKFGDGILDWNSLLYGGTVVSSYVHTQAVASATWVVNHNLGFRPSVELTDTGGNEIVAEVLHVTNNQTNIYLTDAITGQARFN